jgi:exportin-2 (importin alpha re-exporter)
VVRLGGRNFSLIAYRLFTPVYLNIILPESQKLARPLDRKTAVVSFTKTLATSEAFASRYKKGWSFTCEALLKLLELPPLPATGDDIIAEHDVDDMAFGVGFTPLNTVRPRSKDPWPETGHDLKAWVGKYLKEADSKNGGRVSGFVQERLSPEAQKVLASYMTA